MKHTSPLEPSGHIRRLVLAAFVSLLLPATGCNTQNNGDLSGADSAMLATQPSANNPATIPSAVEGRPATKIDTVYREGMPEVVRFTLVHEGMPFSTYVPEGDFKLEGVVPGNGTGIQFMATFGGKPIPEANLYIFVGDGTITLSEIEERVAGKEGIAASNDWRLDKVDGASIGCEWATSSYKLVGLDGSPNIVGQSCLGTHNGRPFYMIATYPKQYAEGFMPRASAILSDLRWKDTGTGLAKE